MKKFNYKNKLFAAFIIGVFSVVSVGFSTYIISNGFTNISKEIKPVELEISQSVFPTVAFNYENSKKLSLTNENYLISDDLYLFFTFNQNYYNNNSISNEFRNYGALYIEIDLTKSIELFKYLNNMVGNSLLSLSDSENSFNIVCENNLFPQFIYRNSEDSFTNYCLRYENNFIYITIPFSQNFSRNGDFYIQKLAENTGNLNKNSWDFMVKLDFMIIKNDGSYAVNNPINLINNAVINISGVSLVS